jgi:hypothetical protein
MSGLLTNEHVRTLTDYFPPADHEFLQGRAYITEAAITARIEEVDPSWTFAIMDVQQRDNRIIVQAALSIQDVTRDNIGMAEVRAKDGREVNDAEKAAATDALKRCARLFGVGRYLLTLPKSVNDVQSLSTWMNSNGQSNEWPSPSTVNYLLGVCQEHGICDTMDEMGSLANVEAPEYTSNWNKYPTGKAAYEAIKLAVNGGIEYEDIPL